MCLRKHGLFAMMVLLGAVGLILLRIFDPTRSGIFPPCPVRYLTGLYCPGCGSLRALHALLHGNLRQAWAMNPLAMALLPFIGYGLASEVHTHFRGHALPGMMLSATSIRVLCAIIVFYGIARNLPLHPFDWLAPGALLHL